jgi:hypothetical protein
MHPNHVIHGSSQNRVRPTDSPRPTPRGIGQGEPRRRGMAVLLALIAVSLAIIIGLALASNRDATSATSSSIVRVASARTAAAGSLDIATRILELNTSIAAGDASDSTRLLCLPATVGGATVSARMTDMLTGMSPTSKTLAVAIVASATIDDVTQETRAVGRVPWASNVARADLDLSEFALAAHGDIAISDGSVVAVWKTAPMAAQGALLSACWAKISFKRAQMITTPLMLLKLKQHHKRQVQLQNLLQLQSTQLSLMVSSTRSLTGMATQRIKISMKM